MLRRIRSGLSLFVLPALLAITGCPSGGGASSSPAASSSAAAVASISAAPAASSAPAPMVSAPPREVAGASQVLVAYKGAELAPKGVTRAKGDAKKIAEEALKKIKKDGAAFEEIAKKYSDDASKNAGGAIGNFERNAMPEAFSKATFDLKVGEISDVVETPRGFHIIKRTR
ncbi:MAG: peptidylprolyl isomerase [Minicystis sp.]